MNGAAIEAAAAAIRAAAKPVILMGSGACTERGIAAAGRLAAKGIRMLTDTFIARQPRGAGRFQPDKMLYFGEMALADLAGVDLMVLACTRTPVAFFAYPAMPSVLIPEGCETITLSALHEDATAALEALADALGAPEAFAPQSLALPKAPKGRTETPTPSATPSPAGCPNTPLSATMQSRPACRYSCRPAAPDPTTGCR